MGMLDGKVAAITHAGRGMGRAIVLLMVEEGAGVVVHDSDASGEGGIADPSVVEGVVREIRDRGGDAVACSASLTSWQGSHELVQTAMDHFGRIDILVNHPNHTEALKGRMIFEISKEEWERVAQAHLKASFFCTRAALPCMRKQKQGRLVHFASAEAVIGGVGHTHHGAAQMAVAGLSRNAAIEMDRYHVTSNCIVPCGGPNAPSDSADVAPLVVFLASDAAQNLTGQVFGVREKEIFLFSQARIQRSIHNSRGWTVDRLSAMFASAMQPHFTPVDTADSYFCWDSNV